VVLGKVADMQTVSGRGSRPEAERQLAAAIDRHREVLASVREPGRPETGQHIAVKAVGRAVHLVSFALRQAAESGVPQERLVELTGWEPELVKEALAQATDPALAPTPSLVARLAPDGLDPGAVAQAAASVEAIERLDVLLQSILADAGNDAWSRAPTELVDLHERLSGQWHAWRHAHGAPAESSAGGA
jgi:hypothetical protein